MADDPKFCPFCGSQNVVWYAVEWDAVSLEPTDLENNAPLTEHQCQSDECKGRSFWT